LLSSFIGPWPFHGPLDKRNFTNIQ
jgi:hypothetical protein